MHRFEVYQGVARRGAVSGLGIVADVIMCLCDDIQQKNHKVYFKFLLHDSTYSGIEATGFGE